MAGVQKHGELSRNTERERASALPLLVCLALTHTKQKQTQVGLSPKRNTIGPPRAVSNSSNLEQLTRPFPTRRLETTRIAYLVASHTRWSPCEFASLHKTGNHAGDAEAIAGVKAQSCVTDRLLFGRE